MQRTQVYFRTRMLTLISVHTSISKYTLSDRAVDQFPHQICSHVRECAEHFSFYLTSSQKLKIAFLVCSMFFFTASTAGFATSPSLSLSRCGGRISNNLDKETNTGLCWCFSIEWINKARNVDEEELGFGHVHKTGSVVCWQIQH